MEQLLLVNPRKRRHKRRRTPPRGPGGRFLKRSSRRRTSSRRRRRNPVPYSLGAVANPRRRRRRASRSVSRRRYRRNPAARFNIVGQLTRGIMPAVAGAGGAIATDVAFGYLPLPAALKTGNLAILSKAVVAVGLGMLVGQFMNRRIGEQMTAGALTVQAHQFLAPMVSGMLPGVGYYGAGYALPGSMGEYISEVPSSLRDVPNTYADSVGEYISD
jgi:hypothetical protein